MDSPGPRCWLVPSSPAPNPIGQRAGRVPVDRSKPRRLEQSRASLFVSWLGRPRPGQPITREGGGGIPLVGRLSQLTPQRPPPRLGAIAAQPSRPRMSDQDFPGNQASERERLAHPWPPSRWAQRSIAETSTGTRFRPVRGLSPWCMASSVSGSRNVLVSENRIGIRATSFTPALPVGTLGDQPRGTAQQAFPIAARRPSDFARLEQSFGSGLGRTESRGIGSRMKVTESRQAESRQAGSRLAGSRKI